MNNIFISETDSAFLLIDPSLDNKTAGLCDLIVVVEDSSIQLALVEKKSNRFLALEVFQFVSNEFEDWNDCFKTTSAKSILLKKYEFSKVKICLSSLQYTLVPEALHHPGDEHAYFKLNFNNYSDLLVNDAHVNTFHLFSIYGVSKELIKELNHLFQDPKIIHHTEILLKSAVKIARSENEKKILLNIRKNEVDILITEGKKLIYLNSFKRNSDEDVLYFTLFTFEQLEFDPENVHVFLSGEIEPESSLYKLLYKYIRKINFVGMDRSLLFGKGFETIPSHFYFTLYNLALCE